MLSTSHCCSLLLLLSAVVWAGSAGASGPGGNPHNGRATLTGTVVSSACTIALEDAWQTVDMGVLPARELKKSGEGQQRKISLHLRSCSLEQQSAEEMQPAVRVVFDGPFRDDPTLFAVGGSARGVALKIRDRHGSQARAGESLPSVPVYGSGQGLSYWLQVVPDGTPLSAGDFYAAIRFSLNYE
ncbi:type 1 fimbrial protein [Salmonella enterica]|nr:type 1 fimbrial protein [Salmonella enterica subsp. enterica serovar Sandiego]ECJ6126305.1 type 1 fimbrial protein [Salmonella enterica]EGD1407063.1 type 1 fimbrial protein [Salmonella enterica]EHH3361034.1 type 1 fimbrial protein [Salmonella enterica subsp. enterica serovar Sandiego]EJE9658134.1 type 1 fimbrial protein [Salmonella enterica]